MEFRIEGDSISFEVSVKNEDVERSALVRLDGGTWQLTPVEPRTYHAASWLAEGRTMMDEVVRRAFQRVHFNLVNAQLRARDNP
jgi:hypothetical protein